MMVDAQINYEAVKKNPSVRLGYDVKDPAFREFVKMMALGSKASFNFNPSDEEIVDYYKKSGGRIHADKDQAAIDSIPNSKKEEIRQILIQAENELPIQEKHV